MKNLSFAHKLVFVLLIIVAPLGIGAKALYDVITFDVVQLNQAQFENPSASAAVTMNAPSSLSTGWTLTLPPNTGTSGQFLRTNGSGTTTWVTAGGGGTPGGSNTQVQFNNAGAFGGISGFTSDATNVTAGSGNLRATSPRITTGLADSGGNTEIGFTATASAVNFLTVTNSITGNPPVLGVSGTDTNIEIDILPKGQAILNLIGKTAISPASLINLDPTLTVTATENSVALVLAGARPATVSAANGTAAANLMTMLGPEGGATSDATASRIAGKGGGYILQSGPGGLQTGASSAGARGGTGGQFDVMTGNGGAATAVTGSVAGGDGGDITLVTGTGGNSATFTGGVGGPFIVTAGTGGRSTGSATNSGDGGGIQLTAGPGGDRAGATGAAGNGGDVDINAGPGGATGGGATAGVDGTINIGVGNAAAINIGASAIVPITINGAVGIGGTLTPNSTAGIVGTTTNNNVNAGSVGEYVESLVPVGTPVSLTSTTAANVTSISLTAGDWDVSGICNFTNGSATVTATACGINATTATIPTDGSQAYSGAVTTVLTTLNSATPARKRFSLAGTTTVFLVARTTFSAGTSAAFGTINARRVR